MEEVRLGQASASWALTPQTKDCLHTAICRFQRSQGKGQDTPLPVRRDDVTTGGGDIGSEGMQEISDLIHALAKSAFCPPPPPHHHVKGIGLSSGFTTRQAVGHQGLVPPREGQNARPSGCRGITENIRKY